MDAKSNYLERKNLDHNLGTASYTSPTDVYVSLHTADPTDAGTGAEVSGGGYARMLVTFNAAGTDGTTGDTTADNDVQLNWTNMPTGTITHVGIWDSETGGNMLYAGELEQGKDLTSGDNFTINVGSLIVQES